MKPLTPMGDLEQRIGLMPIEELLAERDELIKQVAPLRAKYGTFGTHEALRKIELAKLKAIIRGQVTQEKKKVSYNEIDDRAHASGQYVDFIIKATNERATWIELENRMESITDTLNRGQVIARFAAAEVYLTPRQG